MVSKYIIVNEKKRYYRLKNRIEIMLNFNCWFCTYTINDDYINSNIDFVRILKKQFKGMTYIINSDYGSINNRLHYHCIIVSNNEPVHWKYGFCYHKKIFNKNSINLTLYINKLTNHTIKETSKRVIVSRNDLVAKRMKLKQRLNALNKE